ncbi:MAG: metalloregulator ArsR/SmtB family transcription factor [Caldilineaceae bacterium]|nr:metalloregulator ArsR/SmtB family transcription factor [Caldilineaceae bacterium]
MNKDTKYQAISNQLKLLAHPERLRILDVLRREPECVCHLEALLEKPQPYVSQQLRFLRNANMIRDQRRGQNIYYEIADDDVMGWLEHILGPMQEDAWLAHLKKTLPCQCPTCDTNLQVSFAQSYPPQAVEMSKAKMLFLCTGNAARSQMAEAFMRKYAGDEFDIYSAGLEPRGLHPLTLRVMDEVGIDVSGQRSTDLREYLGRVNFGYLITVCARAEKNCPTAFLNSGGTRLDWFFEDPAAYVGTVQEKLNKFREIRDQVDHRIQEWLAQRN